MQIFKNNAQVLFLFFGMIGDIMAVKQMGGGKDGVFDEEEYGSRRQDDPHFIGDHCGVSGHYGSGERCTCLDTRDTYGCLCSYGVYRLVSCICSIRILDVERKADITSELQCKVRCSRCNSPFFYNGMIGDIMAVHSSTPCVLRRPINLMRSDVAFFLKCVVLILY